MSWLSFIEYGLEPSVHRGEELFITYIPDRLQLARLECILLCLSDCSCNRSNCVCWWRWPHREAMDKLIVKRTFLSYKAWSRCQERETPVLPEIGRTATTTRSLESSRPAGDTAADGSWRRTMHQHHQYRSGRKTCHGYLLSNIHKDIVKLVKVMRDICFSCPSARMQSKDLWRPCMFRQTWECISIKIHLSGAPLNSDPPAKRRRFQNWCLCGFVILYLHRFAAGLYFRSIWHTVMSKPLTHSLNVLEEHFTLWDGEQWMLLRP